MTENSGNALTTLTGSQVGRFRIAESIGGGGMGMVYRAHDEALGREVALKFIQPHLTSDEKVASRFRQEARVIASFEHPNICTVHDIGATPEGQLFLAMPLYKGETLQARMERGRLPVQDAVSIAQQMLRGLAKAHAQGIVHRDIKPSNVFITSDEVVKLLDFGIAKLVDTTLTGTGTAGAIGTLSYMSPEQALGEPIDARTDIWATGVVLFEMVTGQRPWHTGIAAAFGQPAGDPPAAILSSRCPDMPVALRDAIMRALARDAKERFATAAEFENALGQSLPTGHSRPVIAKPSARLAIGAVVLMLTAAVGFLWWNQSTKSESASANVGATSSAVRTVAVLPFVDRSEQRDQRFFGDGITEEIISTLSRVEGLRVASSTSVFAYRDRQQDVREIGRLLDVGTVLEGSVQRDGDRLKIRATLVNISDGYTVWSETFDRAAGDAFALQEEIAAAVATALEVRLIDSDGQVATNYRPDAEAYEAYLRGLSLRKQALNPTLSYQEGIVRQFERAVAIDSNFAAAWGELAIAYSSMGWYEHAPPDSAFPRSEIAAARAIALNSRIGNAHVALGYSQLYYRWDLQSAEASFRKAIAVEPRSAVAHQWLANVLTITGRFDDAYAQLELAQAAEPTRLIAQAVECWVGFYSRRYADALSRCNTGLRRTPAGVSINNWRGWVLEAMDSTAAAVAAQRAAVAHSDSAGIYVASLARALVRDGKVGEATMLTRFVESAESRGKVVPAYGIAQIYEALGDKDRALTWLERAYLKRDYQMAFIQIDPQLDGLRDEPRFRTLASRVFGQ